MGRRRGKRARFIEDERSREERGRKVGEHASQKMKDQGREKLEIACKGLKREA